jgi:hypothetical protein
MFLEEPELSGSNLLRREALRVTKPAGYQLSLSRCFLTVAKKRRLARSRLNCKCLTMLEEEGAFADLKKRFELLELKKARVVVE